MTRLDYTGAMTLRWLDLYCGEDPHPRRFDRIETALEYLRRIERLPQEALQVMAEYGVVEPPLARRAYRLSFHTAERRA